MKLRRRPNARFGSLGLLILGAIVMSASAASARTEVLRWTHPDASLVSSWEAHVGSERGRYDRVVPFSNPQVDSDGVLEASIEVADDEVVFIAVGAIGQSGEQSPLSNERERSPDGSGTPPATPPSPPVLIQVVPATN